MAHSKSHTERQETLPFHVLIVAAGRGQRFKNARPKQYMPLHGKTVLHHSIKAFLAQPTCQSVRVIINPDDAELYHDTVKTLNISTEILGGLERKDSVFNGLKNFSNIKDEEIILIHDAARPCVTTQDIQNLLEALKDNRAASLATPIASTLRQVDETNIAAQNIDRKNIRALQTPQAFRYGDLLKAHENADPQKIYTDDTALASDAGIAVKLVDGAETNIKITYEDDLKMAEKILSKPTITVSGIGYDVHAFDPDKSGPVRLCGIDLEHPNALKGHSDADVGMHALTDAILGAIGEGDIGRHFPPSNPDFKDMDSAVFLEKAVNLMQEKQGILQNIDLTLICEAPKIGPHVEDMREKLSKITGLKTNRINVKATTSEGLGFTGRKEGIASQAIVSITLPEHEDE